MAKATESTAEKSAGKKASKKKPAASKNAAKKSAGKKSAASSSTAKKSTAKKSTVKKAPAKQGKAKKSTSKKAVAKTTKAATKKSPSKNMPVKSPFDKKFLTEMRDSLLKERSRYIQSAETLKAEADALVESREPGDVQFDEESGEGDTLAVERERDLALSAHARAAVDEIDAALERLDKGTFGVCVVSAKPIPKERLRAIPWAAKRVEYKAGGFGLR